MDTDIKILLKRAVEVASERGGDCNIKNEHDMATTNVDAMIYLEEAIDRAFGLESSDWREINKKIDEL